ncbi:IclR family transcriptional regulator C-terminal domain-containing protein [Streptomyces hydrogenans]|uniref:IclR family transcriptional regulator domain-containing protein n=1 Tax=Streptomyces hydrogenans TaxID=1873719 RepID=UPI00345CDA44
MCRFTEDCGRCPAPAVAELQGLMDELAGPSDFWDRPDGDFGPLTHLYGRREEERQRANAHYRLGSKALRRGELHAAAGWLGEAASAGHPGALFRLALVVLRATPARADDAWFLIEEAARHGHGDAQRLLAAADSRPPVSAVPALAEDSVFLEELARTLGVPHYLFQPHPARVLPDSFQSHLAAQESSPATSGRGDEERLRGPADLVLVPAPALPATYGPAPAHVNAPDFRRPRLAVLAGGLTLPVPDLTPVSPVRPVVVHTAVDLRGEPWWSAHALRPAILTDLTRHRSTPAVVPARWQATQRARDMLQLIHTADGIDTRALAHRAKMPIHQVARLLDWLRGEQFVDTVGGTHFPGPLMKLLASAEQTQGQNLLPDMLASLRDELGAAVYVSTYTEGEITVQASSFSETAPPVEEVAPFSSTGHASANGKSLLAQLDFASRMDHLGRYPSVQLTGRTITSRLQLIEELDGPGPHSAQFDLLEYSDTALCVAFSLGLPGRASSLALSLPADQYPRLIDSARTLSRRATGILLAHLLAEDLQQPTVHHTGTWESTVPTARHALP